MKKAGRQHRNRLFSLDVKRCSCSCVCMCKRTNKKNSNSKHERLSLHIDLSKQATQAIKKPVKRRLRTLTHENDPGIGENQKYYLRSGRKVTYYKEILKTERHDLSNNQRIHTIDQIDDSRKNQEKVIKGCIAELLNILSDINNNKSTHRRLLSQRSMKQVEHPELKGECRSSKKLANQKVDNEKNINHKIIFNKAQEREGKTVSMRNQGSFKSYVDIIRKRKRQGKIQAVKNLRKGADVETKKIQQSLLLMKVKKNKENKNYLICQQNKSQFIQEKFEKSIEQDNHIKQIECSSIEKINQSSFLSQLGKNILTEVRQETKNQPTIQQKQELVNLSMRKSVQRRQYKKNRASIKNVFPEGFFI